MPLKGSGSGISAMSRIRATVSALKSERARRMKLLAEIRALFSLSGSVAFLRMSQCATLQSSGVVRAADSIALLAVRRSDNIAGDLAQRLRVALKRL
jgi:hypothetical protein